MTVPGRVPETATGDFQFVEPFGLLDQLMLDEAVSDAVVRIKQANVVRLTPLADGETRPSTEGVHRGRRPERAIGAEEKDHEEAKGKVSRTLPCCFRHAIPCNGFAAATRS
jgi:hypothetical protein